MNPIFPDRMLAGCAHGHHWPVEVVWSPMQIELLQDTAPVRLANEVLQHIQVPTPSPRYCAQCFLTRHAAEPASFLRQLPSATEAS
jgi:hypothetical protein